MSGETVRDSAINSICRRAEALLHATRHSQGGEIVMEYVERMECLLHELHRLQPLAFARCFQGLRHTT
jgi:hypothetical protein